MSLIYSRNLNTKEILYFINALYLLLSILVSLLIIKLHGYEARGNIALFISIGQTISSLFLFGLPASALFYVIKDSYFSSNILINFIFTLIITTVFFIGFSFFIDYIQNVPVSLMYIYVITSSTLSFITNGLTSLRKIFLPIFLNCIQSTLLLIYVLNEKNFSIEYFISVNIFFNTLIIFILFYIYARYFNLKVNYSILTEKKYILVAIKNYPISLSNNLTKRVDVLIISYFFNEYITGFYALLSNIREFSNFITRVSLNAISYKLFSTKINYMSLKILRKSEESLLLKVNFIIITFGLLFSGYFLSFIGNINSDDILSFSWVINIILLSFIFNSKYYILSTMLTARNRHFLNTKISILSSFLFIFIITLFSISGIFFLVAFGVLIHSIVNYYLAEYYYRK